MKVHLFNKQGWKIMKIQTPLQYAGARLNDENMEQWNSLGVGEKLFYKYVLENDTTLSSVLLGIFTAYVQFSDFGNDGSIFICRLYI